MDTPTSPQPHTPEPQYSQLGPIWTIEEYETTDECAPCSRMTWKVVDLDDYVIAYDLSEKNAKLIAQSLNALAGVPDPAALLAEVRASLERIYAKLEPHMEDAAEDIGLIETLELMDMARAVLAKLPKGDV